MHAPSAHAACMQFTLILVAACSKLAPLGALHSHGVLLSHQLLGSSVALLLPLPPCCSWLINQLEVSGCSSASLPSKAKVYAHRIMSETHGTFQMRLSFDLTILCALQGICGKVPPSLQGIFHLLQGLIVFSILLVVISFSSV